MVAPWLETLGAGASLAAGAAFGILIGRARPPYWLGGFVAPLLVIGLVTLAHRRPDVGYVQPWSFVIQSRWYIVLRGCALMTLFFCLTPKLDGARQRKALWLFTGLLALLHVLPFAAPAAGRSSYAGLHTSWDASGVCMQSTSHTCGAAATVTALHHLGIDAEEGAVAVAARTNPFSGTQPWDIVDAVETLYPNGRLTGQVRYVPTITDLARQLPFLATVRLSTFADHFVAVLEVDATHVVIGDPLEGRLRLTHAEFLARWRRGGVALYVHNS